MGKLISKILTEKSVRNAIALSAFVVTLATPNAPWGS